MLLPLMLNGLNLDSATIVATITGTGGDGLLESEVVAGGETVIVTLTNDTWIAAGTGPIGSTAQTQALLDGLVAAASPALGWNNAVTLSPSDIARTSDTVATLTLPAAATYSVDSDETLTWTIPAAVLTTSGDAVVASPTIEITAEAEASTAPVGGWKFFDAYDEELQRRIERERRQAEIVEELEEIEEQVDQEIAMLLHEQDEADERQREKERLRFLVRQVSHDAIEREFGERVAKAHQRAIEKATYSALEALVREAKRAQEEEEFMLMSVIATLH